jgi:WD repeat and SOF domain-containing protein 1
LCFAGSDRLLSCGVDRNVKLWAIGSDASDKVCLLISLYGLRIDIKLQNFKPLNVFPEKSAFKSVEFI